MRWVLQKLSRYDQGSRYYSDTVRFHNLILKKQSVIHLAPVAWDWRLHPLQEIAVWDRLLQRSSHNVRPSQETWLAATVTLHRRHTLWKSSAVTSIACTLTYRQQFTIKRVGNNVSVQLAIVSLLLKLLRLLAISHRIWQDLYFVVL